MFNKRVATLLALLLAGSVVLSGPSAALASASSGDSKETSQTETKESGSADSVKGKKTKANRSKKNISSSSTSSSDQTVSKPVRTVSLSADEGTEEKKEESAARDSLSDNTGDLPVSGEDLQEGSDYTYDEGTGALLIMSAKEMSINFAESIVVDSEDGADLILDGLRLTGSPALQVKSGTGTVKIKLLGVNTLGDIQIKNDDGMILSGPGIFVSDSKIEGKVVVSGGNIKASETSFETGQPVNGAEDPLYQVSINGLVKNGTYDITGMRAGTPQTSYSYGDEICADEEGKVFMYLPVGEVQVSLNSDQYVGEVVSTNVSELKKKQDPTPIPSSSPTPDPSSSPSPEPSSDPTPDPSLSPIPSSSLTPTPTQDLQQAQAADNGLYWINEGATYRSGASLQFYATGAGYGPDEPQELNPVRNATRYVPVSWSVTTSTAGVTGSSGSWRKKNREKTVGSTSGNTYTPGEYRFKGSFVLSTNLATSVPCTLRVNYQREIYNGKKWTKDSTTTQTKSVNFYIRNTSITATPTRYPYSTYNRSGVTSTAARSSLSSNARNASTMDDTPIGALVLLMTAAAGSGLVIFRKKRNRL